MPESPHDPPKTFTRSEANALLPAIRPLVEQLQALQRSIVRTNQQLDEAVRKLSQGNGYPIESVKEEIHTLTTHQLQLVEAFQSALEQLERASVMLKDVVTGLVDFYGVLDGKLICLCWKLGEEGIQFWHTLEDGFAGRRPFDAPSA